MRVTLRGVATMDPKLIVAALGEHPDTEQVIRAAMRDVVDEAREILVGIGDPEAADVAAGVRPTGARGAVVPFQARIVPGAIPVGLVTANHPASVRWEFGSTVSAGDLFRRTAHKKGRRRSGGTGAGRSVQPRLPTPVTAFMRTAVERAAQVSGRRAVGT